MDKETLLEHLPSLASVVLLGGTAITILTSNQSGGGDDTDHRWQRQLLLLMPYGLFLVAVAGLAGATAVKRRPHLLGFSAGILLVQLICLIVMGGLVAHVRGKVEQKIVLSVASAIIVVLLIAWSALCAYPKFLRFCFPSKVQVEDGPSTTSEQCPTCGGTTVNGISCNPVIDEQKCLSSCVFEKRKLQCLSSCVFEKRKLQCLSCGGGVSLVFLCEAKP